LKASRWLAALCAVGLSALPSVARAQSARPDPAASGTSAPDAEVDQKVRDLTKAGIAEARKGDLEAARAEFAKAWELKPDTNLAVLLARIEMKLGRFREAAEHWEFYLQNVPPDPTTAAEKLAECRQQLGSVRVSGDPPGAFVYVDGRELGPTPLANDVWLDPGEHTFMARLDERTSPEQKVTVEKGEVRTLTLVISPPEQPAGSPAPAPVTEGTPQKDERAGSPARTVVLVSGSVLTAGALITGIVYTLKASSLGDQANALRHDAQLEADPDSARNNSYCAPSQSSPPPQCAELAATTDDQKAARNVAIGSYIAAGVLATGTAVTYLLWPEQSRKAGLQRNFELGPLAGARGVQLRMKF
jgi:tetratricopeptide (TPR) repeat protein